MYLSATGMTTMAPSAAMTKRMAPTVNSSDIAFSFTKPRFSSSPYTMFRVSKSD